MREGDSRVLSSSSSESRILRDKGILLDLLVEEAFEAALDEYEDRMYGLQVCQYK